MEVDRIPIRAPPNDPNRGQNRAPLPTEMATLRNIQSQNRQLAANIANQLGVARDNHQRIQSRYDQLIREMESLQSELNAMHHHIIMLEQQERFFQGEEKRLDGLLHPIRRYPEDIFLMIIEWAVKMSLRGPFRTATALSHVCKSWRELCLKTGRLWSLIRIPMIKADDAIEAYLDRTKARLGATSAQVILEGLMESPGYNLPARIGRLRINRFGPLSKLGCYLVASKEVVNLDIGPITFLAESLPVLLVEAKSESEHPIAWDCTSLIRVLPIGGRLVMGTLGYAQIGGEGPFPSLYHLIIKNMQIPNLTQHLSQFKGLRTLSITGKVFQLEPLMEDAHLPALIELELRKVRAFPWDRVTAPQLRKASVDVHTNSVIEFLSRHTSLSHVAFKTVINNQTLLRIATSLVNVESLEIRGLLEGLYNSENLFIAFPRLSYLKSVLVRGQSISLEGFENLLRSRWQLHPSTQDTDPSKTLTTWEIITLNDNLASGNWKSSLLLQNLEKNTIKKTLEETCILRGQRIQ